MQTQLSFSPGCFKLSDMTAQVIDFPSEGKRADATIRATVRALMRGKSLSVEDIAPKMGLNPATLYRKLSDKKPAPFKASEVAELAIQLDVSVADLYDGLGGHFTPPEGPESTETATYRYHNPASHSSRHRRPFTLVTSAPPLPSLAHVGSLSEPNSEAA